MVGCFTVSPSIYGILLQPWLRFGRRLEVRTLVPPPRVEVPGSCRTLVPPPPIGSFQTTRAKRLAIEKQRVEPVFRLIRQTGTANFGLRYPFRSRMSGQKTRTLVPPAVSALRYPPHTCGRQMASDFGTPSCPNRAWCDLDNAIRSCRRLISDIGTPVGNSERRKLTAFAPPIAFGLGPLRDSDFGTPSIWPGLQRLSKPTPSQANSAAPATSEKSQNHPRQESYSQEAVGIWNPTPKDRRVARNGFRTLGS
jgi:hypothetical protein